MERYFNPEVMREESELRQRVGQKLKLCPEQLFSHKPKLCPEQYSTVIEVAPDGALKTKESTDETEGA